MQFNVACHFQLQLIHPVCFLEAIGRHCQFAPPALEIKMLLSDHLRGHCLLSDVHMGWKREVSLHHLPLAIGVFL